MQQPCRGSAAADTAEAEPATRGRRQGGPKEVPAWVPWDEQAQQQQAASLAELQVWGSPCMPSTHAPLPSARPAVSPLLADMKNPVQLDMPSLHMP